MSVGRNLVSVLDLDNSVRFGSAYAWAVEEAAASYACLRPEGLRHQTEISAYLRISNGVDICISLNDVNSSDWTVKPSREGFTVESGGAFRHEGMVEPRRIELLTS